MNRSIILALFAVCLLSSCGPSMDERITEAQNKAQAAADEADQLNSKVADLETKVEELEAKVEELEANQ